VRTDPEVVDGGDLLQERSMHPHEMHRVMRSKYWDRLFGVTTGSLYRTVERLQRLGLVEAVGTSRSGGRPERTTYEATVRGRDVFVEQVAGMLANPVEEHPSYMLALTLSRTLSRQVMIAELARRKRSLDRELAGLEAVLDDGIKAGLPTARSLDLRYHLAVLGAERDWTIGVLEDLETGRLEWPANDTEDAGNQTGPELPG
jgi:DNA-binding PadR family transcriptional regulator